MALVGNHMDFFAVCSFLTDNLRKVFDAICKFEKTLRQTLLYYALMEHRFFSDEIKCKRHNRKERIYKK